MEVQRAKRNSLPDWRRALPFAVALAIAAACSEGGEPTATASSAPAPATSRANSSAQPPTQPPTSAAEKPMLIFDDLGGGSPRIMVYPGVGTSEADRQYNDYYEDGDEVPVACQTEGREVVSHPEEGERFEKSTRWFRLDISHEVQFATDTYAFVSSEDLTRIPQCATVPTPAVAA